VGIDRHLDWAGCYNVRDLGGRPNGHLARVPSGWTTSR
jgi:hypothetical protein